MRKLCGIAGAILFFLSACTKIESTNIGTGLIPPIDGVTTLEATLDVFTNNYQDSSSQLLKVYSSDDHVIGTITNDPVFGTTSATTYLELKPAYYKFSLPGGATLVPDSVVLILSYKGVYGDTDAVQNWEVKELSAPIRGDTVYNVSTSFPTYPQVLNEGSQIQDIRLFNDSVNDRFEAAANQIRIKLSSAFANRLMKEYNVEDGGPYLNDTVFREAFKGFAIGPKDGSSGSALVRVNLADTNTKLALFYKYQAADATMDTAVSYFRFSDGSGSAFSGHANYIKRNYDGYRVKTEWTNVSNNSPFTFIQTAPGSFATIKIPDLGSFPNAIIHRAELLMFQDTTIDNVQSILTPPIYLLLSTYDSANNVKLNIHNDFIVSSGTSNAISFGGFLTQKSIPGFADVNAYTFDVTRYVQGIVTRKDYNNTLRLSAPVNDSLKYTDPYPITATSGTFFFQPSNANNVADGRVILGGGSSVTPQLRMRLRIIYSRI